MLCFVKISDSESDGESSSESDSDGDSLRVQTSAVSSANGTW